MLDMPLPGNFRNIGHQIEAKKAEKTCGSD